MMRLLFGMCLVDGRLPASFTCHSTSSELGGVREPLDWAGRPLPLAAHSILRPFEWFTI